MKNVSCYGVYLLSSQGNALIIFFEYTNGRKCMHIQIILEPPYKVWTWSDGNFTKEYIFVFNPLTLILLPKEMELMACASTLINNIWAAQ